jgi:hypothetical protein
MALGPIPAAIRAKGRGPPGISGAGQFLVTCCVPGRSSREWRVSMASDRFQSGGRSRPRCQQRLPGRRVSRRAPASRRRSSRQVGPLRREQLLRSPSGLVRLSLARLSLVQASLVRLSLTTRTPRRCPLSCPTGPSRQTDRDRRSERSDLRRRTLRRQRGPPLTARRPGSPANPNPGCGDRSSLPTPARPLARASGSRLTRPLRSGPGLRPLSPRRPGPRRLGPGRLGPGRLGPGRLGPGRLGPHRPGPRPHHARRVRRARRRHWSRL